MECTRNFHNIMMHKKYLTILSHRLKNKQNTGENVMKTRLTAHGKAAKQQGAKTTNNNHLLSIYFVILGISLSPLSWSAQITQEPTLTMDPNGVTPLAGVVQLTTDIPARVTLSITNGTESWTREFAQFETEHYLPILGLKPDNSYSIVITVTDEEGQIETLSPALQAETDPLPADFPTISVLTSEPSRMEPGYTLIDKFARAPANTTPDSTPNGTLTRYSVILDNTGEVVWYSTLGHRDMSQLPNGNITYKAAQNLVEKDLLGNTINSYSLNPAQTHHDIEITTHGTILSLHKESFFVEGYPTSYTDPNAPTISTYIEDNPVVELSLDGQLLNKWYLADMLDPTRLTYSSLVISNFGTDMYDWAHANAVLHDPSDDSIIVSIRHQDAVIKFSRTTGSLKWILANHDSWPPELQPYLLTPVGEPFEWQYHQHAPTLTPSGTLLLFDNGNYRATPFDGREIVKFKENYSRAVEYAIDEENMEVEQIWEYGKYVDNTYFDHGVGDADHMKKTGNILITHGSVSLIGGISSDLIGMGISHMRFIEVNHNTPAEKIFEVAIYDPTPGAKISGYRSERIPDLYPQDTDKDGIADFQDNCVLHANGPLIPDSGGNYQLDTDRDGFGNLCDADLNNDGLTNSLDLGLFRQAFYTNDTQSDFDPDADLNGDNAVNSLDLGIVRALFNQPPGPSAAIPQ
jgi:arylsulfate sulfotransferase